MLPHCFSVVLAMDVSHKAHIVHDEQHIMLENTDCRVEGPDFIEAKAISVSNRCVDEVVLGLPKSD